jgi:hypothetical protein
MFCKERSNHESSGTEIRVFDSWTRILMSARSQHRSKKDSLWKPSPDNKVTVNNHDVLKTDPMRERERSRK